MSSIKLTADSGGGTFELKAPSSGSNARVLTVPDTASGTVLTTTSPKAGNIIQVKNAYKTDTSSTSSSTFANIGSLSVSITATASTSKYFVIANLTGSSPNQLRLRLARDGSGISTGVTDGNRVGIGGILQRSNQSDYGFQATTLHTLTGAIGDTNAHTFTVQFAIEVGGGTSYIGRNINDLNNDSGFRCSSLLTVMEVAA